MDQLEIRVENGRTSFQPEEALRGRCEWVLEEPQESVELHLLWYTQGKGDEDAAVVRTERFASSGRHGSAEFDFVLPAAPYSFAGRLISLTWALELVIPTTDVSTRLEIVVAPGKEAVCLGGHR